MRYEHVIIFQSASGEAAVSRRRNGAGWEYYLEAMPTEFAGEVHEHLRVFLVGPFDSIATALETLARDGAWMREHPVMVHEDVRGAVAELIAEAGRLTEIALDESWRDMGIDSDG